ncbi:MAG: outer membrane protein assembly factor BamE [Betaproteobacteria bacterium]|nr:MAG: outer membrane protein assembly factor BamE [Betaproteobacteria bacterium]
MFLRALAAMAVLFLASCSSIGLPTVGFKPYRMEIQQGNFVSQEAVSQLKLGMSKDQVRFVLGTPLITDSFHADRWDYIFRRQRVNSNALEQRKIAVLFADGKLKRIEGDVTPAANADAAAIKTPETIPAAAASAPTPPAVVAPSAPDAAKPAPAAAAPQPAAAAAAKAAEKSWWERLKEKLKF